MENIEGKKIITRQARHTFDLFEKLSEHEKNELLKMIKPDYRSVLVKFYIEKKSLDEIASEHGTSRQAVAFRKSHALKEIKKVYENKKFSVKGKTDSVTYGNKNFLLSTRKRTAQVAKILDFETELYPYLSNDERKVVENFMLKFNEIEFRKIAPSESEAMQKVRLAVSHVFGIINAIVKKKEQINEIYKKIGGESELSDLELFLDEKEKLVLNEYLLNLDPQANKYIDKEFGISGSELGPKTSSVRRVIDRYAKNKQEVIDFINKSGGEDTLLFEFSQYLDEDEFEVLVAIYMDFHYDSKTAFYNSNQMKVSEFISAEKSMKEKLEIFLKRKPVVDALIKNAGGIDEIYDKIASTLDEKFMTVLVYNTLSCCPPSHQELGKSIGVFPETITRMDKELTEKLKELAKSKQKQ